MIEAKELRIGNLVCYRDKHLEVLSITPTHPFLNAIFFSVSEIVSGYEDIQPIPLTEEWLLKLGFKKWNTKELIYSKSKSILHKRKDGWVLNRRTKVILFVHQLQNLHFALTGEELELREDSK